MLAAFIRDGGPEGRTRTEISVDYFKAQHAGRAAASAGPMGDRGVTTCLVHY